MFSKRVKKTIAAFRFSNIVTSLSIKKHRRCEEKTDIEFFRVSFTLKVEVKTCSKEMGGTEEKRELQKVNSISK